MPPSSTPSDGHTLLTAVRRTLRAHRMLAPGDRVLVGVSGGPDSMALLHVLGRLGAELKIRLGAAHLNHRLRGAAAERDAEVVMRAAAALDCPCHVGSAHILKVKYGLGLSLEEAARRVRYAFFKKIMIDRGYDKLALGHHMDDNAEQMLMALLRGSGPRGLSGIPPVRGNRIIRPLIDTRRTQIEAFLRQAAITSVRDASNDDPGFARNRIRHHLLPLLTSQYNPRIAVHLNRLADVIRTEEAWIDELVRTPYEAAVLMREKNTLTLSVERLRRAHPALTRRMIRKALEALCGTLRRITFAHIQSVQRLLREDGGEKESHLPGRIRVRRNGDRLLLHLTGGHGRGAVPAAAAEPAETVIPAPFPAHIASRSMGIGLRFSTCPPNRLPRWRNVGPNRVYVDRDRLVPPLTLRPVTPGDRFTPLGAGGSQKVKKFFIDHHIPRRIRAMTPVLKDRQRIIWLIGQRVDEHVKITAATTRVLAIEFFLLDTR
jgi:tRNA(Ile)-lysidine synthase